MSQVHISSQTHTVTVNHDGGDLSYIVEKAQKLWDDTKPPDAGAGPAYGFSMERDRGLDVSRDKRWGGEIDPVRAAS
jgi:hypothetical protein